jgi:Na+-translocating ferredoxin:NAD+ oxidoreductase subunit G
LTLICCGASLALAFVHQQTREPIAYQQHRKLMRAVSAVFPGYGDAADLRVVSVPVCETAHTADAAECRTLYHVGHLHQTLGTAFSVTVPGYAGPIVVMLGVNSADTISGIHVVAHSETPGLGSHISDQRFVRQFVGRGAHDTGWALRKDGGEIDQVSGATVSSAAVVRAVEAGLRSYSTHKEAISAAAASAGG